jgi:pectinesterase
MNRTPFLASLLLIAVAALPTWAADPAPSATPKASPAPGPKMIRVQPHTPPGVTLLTKDVAVYPEHTVTLTLYVPDAPGTYPAILDIHGGGWSARQVENDKPMMERLATRGFVAALVSYRLSGEAKYPAALSDCKSALRYLRAHAQELKLDPKRIGVMGGSAGGHLSALTAMTSGLPQFEGEGPDRDQSSAVQACIVMAGSMSVIPPDPSKTSPGALAFFGVDYATNPDLYAQASPITHVRAGVPPVTFIEGEKDTVKLGRAEMQEKLRQLGIETDLHTLKDAPHPFWMGQPWLDETVEIATAYFKKHLGEPVLPPSVKKQ